MLARQRLFSLAQVCDDDARSLCQWSNAPRDRGFLGTLRESLYFMRVFKRDGYYHAEYYDCEGVRQRKSTRCTDKSAAQELATKWERDAANPHSAAIREETLGRSLARLIANTSNPRTASFYTQKAGHLLGVLGADTQIAKLRPRHIDAFIRARREQENPPSEHTIHKELATLKVALRTSARLELWTGSTLALIPRHSAQYEPRKRWLPVTEVYALITAFHRDYADHAARIAFAVATGAEWSAMDGALRADLTDEFVRVRGTKSAKRDREVPIVTQWQRDLLAFVKRSARGPDGFLFHPWHQSSSLLSLKRACERASIEPCSWHDLRRSFAQLLRREGAHLEDLSPVLGHANTRVTQAVYAALDKHGLRDRLLATVHGATDLPQENRVPNTCQTESYSLDSSDTSDTRNIEIPCESSGSSGTRTRSQRIKSPLRYRLRQRPSAIEKLFATDCVGNA